MTLHRTQTLSPALQYIQEVFTHETPELAAIAPALTDQEQVMQISPIEARLLQVIMALNHVKTVVEVGVLAGYSAIHMAQMVPAGGKVYAIDRIPVYIERAKRYAGQCGVQDRIEFYEGEALELLPRLAAKGPFDMMFIDADKGNYLHYLNWAETHIRPGGVIVGDNALLFGHVYQSTCPPEIPETTYKVMRDFNKRLADPTRYISIMIPTLEGMAVAVKR